MPNKGCVPACSSNYRTGEKAQVFSFQKDEVLRTKCLSAIPRKDFAPTENNKVCALHFDESCLERKTSYTDPRTGRVLEVSLKAPRLRQGSVPTLFPGCPSYLSTQDGCSSRLTPESKRIRREAFDLARAIAESAACYQSEEIQRTFSYLPELRARLKTVYGPDVWTVIHRPNRTLFLNIVNESEPVLHSSVTVSVGTKISACFRSRRLKRFGNYVVPNEIKDVNVLLELLNRMQHIESSECPSDGIPHIVCILLEKIEQRITESKRDMVRFLKEQVTLLVKERVQYSSEVMVPACILHTISPHAYKFLRFSGLATSEYDKKSVFFI
ncbi:uncharacterized protein LOC142572502 [Dermacentor variabilis]|uniref:uncharacterized protein LOC142572502 n=1 Tax=Dermacentor variabilis TaxID=34621 RepID=UPI003F5C3631